MSPQVRCPPIRGKLTTRREEKLVARGSEILQIAEVLASRTLIDGRVNLEADEVCASGEMYCQAAKPSDGDPFLEAVGETEVHQRRGPRVQPVRGEAQGKSDVSDRADQGVGEGISLPVDPALSEADDVNVCSGTCNDTEQEQAATAHHEHFVRQRPALQHRAERAQRPLQPFDLKHTCILAA